MKYTQEQRLDIGHKLFIHELTIADAMNLYKIGRSTAEKYLTDYKRANGLKVSPSAKTSILSSTQSPDIETYMSMSKEELINELILAKANELRAKKGYEVKGVGANKEFISLNNKNTKS